MSVRLMSDVFRNVHGIPSGRRMLLVVLADFANDEGICWPSIKSLATNADLGERHVSAELKELAKDGFLSIEDVPGKSNHYRLHIPQGMNHSSGVKASKGMNHSSGVNHSSSRTTVHPTPEPQFTPGGEPQFIQTINRTVKEPSEGAHARSRQAKKVPIPGDFEMTEATRAWCAEQGYDRQLVEQQLVQFRLSAVANNRLYANWQAAFQNWLKKCESDGWGQVKATSRIPKVA